MSRPEGVRPQWSRPSPLGSMNEMDAIGTIASPLLAGFSLASVIVVSDDAQNFRWPGSAMLALSIAAITLIGALQSALAARSYLWSPGDVATWWPDVKEESGREKWLRAQQSWAFERWRIWTKRTRMAYNCGIVVLLLGLALALPPQQNNGGQGSLRWAASGVAFAACLGEIAWIVTLYWRRHRKPLGLPPG
jgi:MFS family permease